MNVSMSQNSEAGARSGVHSDRGMVSIIWSDQIMKS